MKALDKMKIHNNGKKVMDLNFNVFLNNKTSK
jgi:hypothetical protein